MPKRCSRREKRKDLQGSTSKWLTDFNTPCVSWPPSGERTSELSCLAGCKRQHLVHVCQIARYDIPECDANHNLDLSIFAMVHGVPRVFSWLAAFARFLWDWAGSFYQ